MTRFDRLTQASLVLAHLPAEHVIRILRKLGPRHRRAVRRRLESFTQQELDHCSGAVREFVAAYWRIDPAADSTPPRPHSRLTSASERGASSLPEVPVAADTPLAPDQRGAAADFSFLEGLTDHEFLSIVRDELPTVVALVLSQLSDATQRRLLAAMPEPMRDQVSALAQQHAERARTPATRSVLQLLHNTLLRRAAGFNLTPSRRSAPSVPSRGPAPVMPAPAAGAARQQGSANDQPSERHNAEPHGERWIMRHDQPGWGRSTTLTARLRRQPGSARPEHRASDFNAIVRLPAPRIRSFLSRTPLPELAVALVGAHRLVKQRLLEQMLPRERVNLQEHLRMLGPVRRERSDRQRARLARLLPDV